MADVIIALQNTPIPTILVIGGIVFLFLGVVGKLGAQVDVPTDRQKWAFVVGVLLLISGIGLYATPSLRAPGTTASPTLIALATDTRTPSAPTVMAATSSLSPISTPSPTVPSPIPEAPRTATATNPLLSTITRTPTPTNQPVSTITGAPQPTSNTVMIFNQQSVYSAHTDRSSWSWTVEQAENAECIRCHSGTAFPSYLNDPASVTVWKGSGPPLTCLSCHKEDTSDGNYGLRVVGKPVAVAFAAKDHGLSGICETCHNGRRNSDDFAQGKNEAYPHYSNEAELMNDTGGITYGQNVPNSPHGMMIGVAPVPDPVNLGAFLWSRPDDRKGQVPGSCVYCHMYPGPKDAKDSNYMKVGEHTFNTFSPDGKTIYNGSCKPCHGDLKTFNIPAKADYDGNGRIEGVQDEVRGLLNVLWKALEAKGLKRSDSGFPYITTTGNIDTKTKNARYNFQYVYGRMWTSATDNGNQGRAAAIHNFKRSVALLQLSYKDLTGKDVPNATVMR